MLDLVRLCRMCESGMGSPTWPDGGAILDQPVKLVQAFNMIRTISPFYEADKP